MVGSSWKKLTDECLTAVEEKLGAGVGVRAVAMRFERIIFAMSKYWCIHAPTVHLRSLICTQKCLPRHQRARAFILIIILKYMCYRLGPKNYDGILNID